MVDIAAHIQHRAQQLHLVWPSAQSAGIGDVLNACALSLTGQAAISERPVPAELSWGAWDRICVILVDGLGANNLRQRGGHAPTLRRSLATALTLRSPYPSTTAASIASFGTTAGTGRTGMLGYTVRNPESGSLGNLVSWTGLPAPEVWQPEPSVFEILEQRSIAVTSIGPSRFADSGMTSASLRGGAYRAAESWAERIDGAAHVLRQPGLAYVYWGDLDKAGHHYGWQSEQWGSELEKVDFGVRRLLAQLSKRTLVLLVADHGMIDVDLERRWNVATEPHLRENVELVAGEPRALHVHLRDVERRDVTLDVWRNELADNALVMTRDEAISSGLFGPVAPAHLSRIGDLVVAMANRATVVDSRTQTSASLQLVGVHGSLTSWEVEIPLLQWEVRD